MHPALLLLSLALLLAAALALFSWRSTRRIEAFLPPCGRFVDIDGQRLHVLDQGSGPALLLLHGLCGQMGHFNYGVVDELARSFRVVAVDRPGSGYSQRPSHMPADLSSQAATIARLIDTLGLERPTLVGHSLGGAVALTLALEHPGKAGALALIAPLTHAPDKLPDIFKPLTLRPAWLRRFVAHTVAVPAALLTSTRALQQAFAPEAVPEDFDTRGAGLIGVRPSHYLASAADLDVLFGHMERLAARYGELRLPVAVLFGRDDRLLDWRANGAALVEKLPDARLELVEGGHMLLVTRPGLTARFIAEAAAARPLAA